MSLPNCKQVISRLSVMRSNILVVAGHAGSRMVKVELTSEVVLGGHGLGECALNINTVLLLSHIGHGMWIDDCVGRRFV
jgi:hypothetical protein